MTSFALTTDLDGLIRVSRLSLIARYGHEPERGSHEDDVVADSFSADLPLSRELLDACLDRIAEADPTAKVLPGGPITPDELEELQVMAHGYLWERLIDDQLINFDELLAWCEAVDRTKIKLGGKGTPLNTREAVSSVLRHFWPDQTGSRDALWALVDERLELHAELGLSSHVEPRVALKQMIVHQLEEMDPSSTH